MCHYTDRFFEALLNIEHEHTFWPTPQERSRIERQFADDCDIPSGCVGVVDGCHVVLWARPGTDDFSDYYNRKGSYSYNVQMVCDANKVIRQVQVGFAGSAHDSRVYGCSWFLDEASGAFDSGQYLLADSAYPPGDHCVTVFKREVGCTGFSGDEVRLCHDPHRTRTEPHSNIVQTSVHNDTSYHAATNSLKCGTSPPRRCHAHGS